MDFKLDMQMKRILLGFVVLLLCIGSYFIFFNKQRPSSNLPLSRSLGYHFEVKNTGNRAVEEAVLRVFAPAELPGRQVREAIEASHEYTVESDRFGNAVLRFALDTIAPFGSRTVSINTRLGLAETVPVYKKLSSSETAAYLNPQTFIESDAPEIEKVAASLGDDKDPLKTARRIFDWVSGHMTYSGPVGKDRGALFACENKRGDCTDGAYLVVALSRAAGIPGRAMGGFISDQDANLSPDGFHNWAEVFIDGRWWLADTVNRQFTEYSNRYVVFQVLGEKSDLRPLPFTRFELEGERLVVRMKG